MKRSCGILLPVSALPSPYGIGTFGREAYCFIDFLAQAGQSWWQLLPVGPTGYGDSPYQSFSAYAGNPYFVDLDLLIQDGLLQRAEVEAVDWGNSPGQVEYSKIYQNRFGLLQKAADRGWDRDREAVTGFCAENPWLPDYTLFMALKRRFDMRPWTEWEEDIRLRRPEAVERWRTALEPEIRRYTYIQYLFFRQWNALRTYARDRGIGIIGDLPIYVAMDSADVWSDPKSFQLDEKNMPKEVSGVPPDYFSADGQLWGNPLYNWESMAAGGYLWWVRRIAGAARLYDVLRIDHFRGLESYWAVPFGETTARNGRWVKGPGMELVSVLTREFPQLRFIAEDLGYPTPEVEQLLKDSGFPGMKLLEFAFSAQEPGSFLPHTYSPHCVCYTGTHDNAPVAGWLAGAPDGDRAMATQYLGLNEAEGWNWGFIRGGMSSVAELFVAQMQDYLGLGAEARMNTPGTLGGNWQWRLTPGQLTGELAQRIAVMTKLYGR